MKKLKPSRTSLNPSGNIDISILPCSYACMLLSLKQKDQARVRQQVQKHKFFCPYGYSQLQVAIISIILTPHVVLSYCYVANVITVAYGIETTADAVRGAIVRLIKNGWVCKERAIYGHHRGNRYTLKTVPCSHIPALHSEISLPVQNTAQASMQPEAQDNLSRKIDRENLSFFLETESEAQKHLETLTDDDISFHWPTLARHGFGVNQIKQIIQRREQVGEGVENILQGLTYAEWELASEKMIDKTGNPVGSPLDWVFKSLATHGYYRRPKGYCSPTEQAEKDAVEEQEQLAKARETHFKTACEAWIESLTVTEQEKILGQSDRSRFMPKDIVLRTYFRNTLWPDMTKDSNP